MGRKSPFQTRQVRSFDRRLDRVIFTALLAVLWADSAAEAQSNAYTYELTPYAAYRMGGSFDEKDGDGRVEFNDSSAEGFMFNVMANPNGQYELIYARQRTDADTSGFFANDPPFDMDVENLQFGGTYLFDGDDVRPFIALTFGATKFDPKLPDAGPESFFSASFGGGIQINARKRLGVRIEARVFTTFVGEDGAIFCSSIDGAGACLIQIDGSSLSQWEARAGLVFRF